MKVVLLDEPQADELKVHDALVNWGFWCREKWTPNKARSAEGNHRAEKGNIYDPPPARIAIDTVGATEVNAALLDLPATFRTCLSLRYYQQLPDAKIKTALNLTRRRYVVFIREARLELSAVLQRRGTPV